MNLHIDKDKHTEILFILGFFLQGIWNFLQFLSHQPSNRSHSAPIAELRTHRTTTKVKKMPPGDAENHGLPNYPPPEIAGVPYDQGLLTIGFPW